jgi:hypothetical protein
MKSRHTLLLLILSILFACKGDEPLPTCDSVEEAPKNFLDYWFFPEGSYYVYKLRGEERYDTMRYYYVDEEYYEPYDHHSTTFPCTKIYGVYANHSDPFFLNEAGDSYFLFNTYKLDDTNWYLEQSGGTTFAAAEGLFIYPYIAGESQINGNNLNIIDSLPLPIDNMDEVLHIQKGIADTTKPFDPWLTDIYFKKGIGMVRFDLSSQMFWELVDYHIEQTK